MDNLFLLQTGLEAEGYEVELADSGRSAMAKVETVLPDLILLDVMMPDMNGYEVTRQIRQKQEVPYSITVVFIQLKPENACDSGRNERLLDGFYASKTNEGRVQVAKLSGTTVSKASVAFPRGST